MSTDVRSDFKTLLTASVASAMKALLCDKHLYQSIEVDLSFTKALAEAAYAENKRFARLGSGGGLLTVQELEQNLRGAAAWHWIPKGTDRFLTNTQLSSTMPFPLPTINTLCPACAERWPFNPMTEDSLCALGERNQQWYYLSYECQQCKGPPVRFMVRRDGLKLRLVGRDPLEVVPVPKVLPKAPGKYYSNALIAHHAGQTLAGLFLLRVFIEQFWRSLAVVKELLQKDSRATGEKQGETYQTTLPPDFRSRFPSLSDVYGKLSAAIHAGDDEANAVLFDDSCKKIEEHFDARRLYKIGDGQSG